LIGGNIDIIELTRQVKTEFSGYLRNPTPGNLPSPGLVAQLNLKQSVQRILDRLKMIE